MLEGGFEQMVGVCVRKQANEEGNLTLPKFTGETYNYFQVFWKKYNFMHFERLNAFQNA